MTFAHDVQASIPILANLLASSCGVEVRWGGAIRPSVSGNIIHMPDLPLEGENLKTWALGYTAQVTARLKHSTPVKLGKNPAVKDIFDIIEDPRVERAHVRTLPGVQTWLEDLTEELLVEGRIPGIDPEASLPDQVRRWFVFRSGYEMCGYDCLEQLAEQQDALMRQVFDATTFASLSDCLEQTRSVGTSEESAELATRLAQILEIAQPNEDPPAEEPQGDSGDPGDDGGGSGSDGTGPQGPTAEQIKALRQQVTALSADENWGQTPVDKASLVADRLGEAIDDAVRDGAPGYGDAESGDAGNGAGNSPVRFPRECVASVKGDATPMLSKVRKATVAVRSRLDEALEEACETHRSPSRSGRRLVRDAGARFVRGNLRVFERREEGIDIDTALVLVLDKSGSMERDGKLAAAVESALVLCDAFSSVDGVRTAVTVFPHKASGCDDGVAVVKAFDDSFGVAASALAALVTEGRTPMPGALLHAHQMLAQVQASRKMVVLVCDGQPDGGPEQTQAVIRSGARNGISHMGIGIGVMLNHLMASSISINTVDDLPNQVLGLVRNALLNEDELKAA